MSDINDAVTDQTQQEQPEKAKATRGGRSRSKSPPGRTRRSPGRRKAAASASEAPVSDGAATAEVVERVVEEPENGESLRDQPQGPSEGGAGPDDAVAGVAPAASAASPEAEVSVADSPRKPRERRRGGRGRTRRRKTLPPPTEADIPEPLEVAAAADPGVLDEALQEEAVEILTEVAEGIEPEHLVEQETRWPGAAEADVEVEPVHRGRGADPAPGRVTGAADSPIEQAAIETAHAAAEAITGEAPLKRRRRRRRRGRRGRGEGAEQAGSGQPVAAQGPAQTVKTVSEAAPVAALEAEEILIEDDEAEPDQATPGKIMLVNVAQGDECRIAMLEKQRLQEFYVERTAALSHVGNIYKGLVTNVEPSIQAAFVDFGQGKNGFLHISDLQPQYFPGGGEAEDVGRKTPRRERPLIQRCLRRNQEIIVQVTKEGIGTKGATLTTYIALPGRYLVMMPGMSRLGVSRKIEEDETRRQMRDVLKQLELPDDAGFILRTAGMGRNRRDLQRDLNYLVRLWRQIEKRRSGGKGAAELYRESDLVTRTLRDVVTTDVQEILIDSLPVCDRARQFLRLLSPRLAERVKHYDAAEPLFFKYGVEDEIDKIYSKRVPLASGGSLVIESTEALVAIDVNSGKFREAPDPEESAYRINMEAAEEIARQLSLRDLGGVIICDFIDMHMERHRREIERALREALKKHKERAEILRMSRFGIIEMTRQRQRASIVRSMLVDCPHCGGGGLIKSAETLMLEALRAIQTTANHPEVARIEVRVNPHVAQLLLNGKRQMLAAIEEQTHRTILIVPAPEAPANKIAVTCLDNRGWTVQVPLPKALMNGG